MSNRNPDVDVWFEAYENPQKELVQAVREAILEADPRVTEAIKWKAHPLGRGHRPVHPRAWGLMRSLVPRIRATQWHETAAQVRL